MTFDHEMDIALRTARRAGEVALRYFALEMDDEQEKPDLSPVTIADKECEKLITQVLSEEFPEDGIVGEEGAFRNSSSGRRWIIDPIDGTRDFVRRTPFWANQIALEAAGRIVLGLIYFPRLQEMFHAQSGAGCFWNDAPTRSSQVNRLERALLMINGFAPLWGKVGMDPIRFLTETCWTVRSYSGCYDVTMIARGKGDVWLSGSGKEWDYAPAKVIAEECGARFFNINGDDRIDQDNCIICTAELESELRKLLCKPK